MIAVRLALAAVCLAAAVTLAIGTPFEISLIIVSLVGIALVASM